MLRRSVIPSKAELSSMSDIVIILYSGFSGQTCWSGELANQDAQQNR
jgi:hypothetical protein